MAPPLIRLSGKVPLDRNWPSGPRLDPDRWRSKLESHVGNVGLVTGSGLAVVDLDTYKPEGAETFRLLTERGILGADTWLCRTPRGGVHLYYTYDPATTDIGCGSFAGMKLDDGTVLPGGGEWKADGGFCAAVPSAGYVWESGLWAR